MAGHSSCEIEDEKDETGRFNKSGQFISTIKGTSSTYGGGGIGDCADDFDNIFKASGGR